MAIGRAIGRVSGDKGPHRGFRFGLVGGRLYAPAYLEAERSFYQAFSDNLRIATTDVPLVTGYECLQTPEVIASHVRQYLDEVRHLGR